MSENGSSIENSPAGLSKFLERAARTWARRRASLPLLSLMIFLHGSGFASAQPAQNAEPEYEEEANEPGSCPSWLDEKDNRRRVSVIVANLSRTTLMEPKDPQDALDIARNSLDTYLGLYGQQREDALKMTESDFVACVPELGKLLIKNDSRRKEDIAKRQEANQPAGRLLDAYKDYQAVKKCAEARAAYEVKYIQDSELEEAKAISKLVEEKLTAADPSIDKDKLWNEAQNEPATRGNDEVRAVAAVTRAIALSAIGRNEFTDAGQSLCRVSLDTLRRMKASLAPETQKVRKDF